MRLTHSKWYLPAVVVLLAAGVFWIWLSIAPPGTTTNGKIPAPRQGFAAPDFTLTTIDGESIKLSDLNGHPVLINLWASWCGPCRAEMPAIQRVYETYQARGFIVLAVNATNQDTSNAAVNFVGEHNLTFPILLDLDGRVSNAYQLRALPSTFFVDHEGIIQEVVIGGPMADALLQTRVEQLLGRLR